jgi:hypothetical protein
MADEVIVIHGGNWNALARAHGHSSTKGFAPGRLLPAIAAKPEG